MRVDYVKVKVEIRDQSKKNLDFFKKLDKRQATGAITITITITTTGKRIIYPLLLLLIAAQACKSLVSLLSSA